MRLNFNQSRSRWDRFKRYLPRFFGRRRQEHLESRIFRAKPRMHDLLTTRQKIWLGVGIVLLGGIIGLFVFSEQFQITKVTIDRSSLDLPLAEMEAAVRQSALGQSIWEVDTVEIAANLKKIRPDIARVSVRKKYPNELTVQVFKYPIVAELRVGTEPIFLNENGYRVEGEMPDRDTFLLTLGEAVVIDDPAVQIVKPEYLIAMRDMAFYFSATTELGVLSVKYFPTAREAHIKTEKNFDLWIDLTRDWRAQLDKLTVASSQLPIATGSYEYIDLRVLNKIFYLKR